MGLCVYFYNKLQEANFHDAPSSTSQINNNIEYEPAASWKRRKATMPVAKGEVRLPASLLSEEEDSFPSFGTATFPVLSIPNWGAMSSASEWDREYSKMTRSDLVPVPSYDLGVLMQPMSLLLKNRAKNEDIITAKLFYSTRFFGAYDLDAGEFSGMHPGVDLKLALNTPIRSIGGGRVYRVAKDRNMGLHVILEHRIPNEGTFYSLYGHLGRISVARGDNVLPGTQIGTVGMTGQSTAPHLHLQVDRSVGMPHKRFWPAENMTSAEATAFTVNPITFIAEYGASAIAEKQRARPNT